MKKKQTKLRVIALMVMVSLLLGLFPVSAFAGTSADNPAAEGFGTDGLYVDAPEVLDPRLQNYTIDKLPEELEENLNLDDTALRFDVADAEDPYSITTINSDGTKTLRVFGEPVKYVDEETDKVEFIDTTLTAAKDGENAFQCVTNSKKSYFPKDISKGVLLTNGKRSVTMTPVISETKKNGKIKYKKVKIKGKNHAQYEEVFGEGTSLQYVPTVNGIKENIVLEEYNGTNTFSYIIDAKKLVPKETEGTTITFIDPETEEEVFKIDETFIYDSRYNTENRTENSVSYNNYYTVEEQKNGKYLLTTIVDKAFLESPETVYPVTVDPELKWAEDNNVVSFTSISSAGDTVQDSLIGIMDTDVWYTYIRLHNLYRYVYMNTNLIEKVELSVDLTYLNAGCNNIKLCRFENDVPYFWGTTYELKSSHINALCTPFAIGTFDSPQNNEIDITEQFKEWIAGSIQMYGSTFIPGFYVYQNSVNHCYTISNAEIRINYTEDNTLSEDIYYIKSGNNYLYAERESASNVQVYWSNETQQPTEDKYKWIVQKDTPSGLYRIKTYLSGNINNYCFCNDEIDVSLRAYSNNAQQQWRIVENVPGSGVFRILSNLVESYLKIDAVTLNGFKNIESIRYNGKCTTETTAQHWEFIPCQSDNTVSTGVEKEVSDWPSAAAQSNQNLLLDITPEYIQYKVRGNIITTGSGTAYPYVESTMTDGGKMTDGAISGANVDLRSYTLKEQGENGYIRYIDRNDRHYRDKGELYLDIPYDLGGQKEFNTLWFATNTQDNYYQVGAFEVYASDRMDTLYVTKNKIADFDHCSGKWSGVVNFTLRENVTAQYIGIRITQGVLQKPETNPWTPSELEHAYARIRDIAVFDSHRRKLIIQNCYDGGMLERWNADDDDIKGVLGLGGMEQAAKQFLESLEYKGENIGLDITFTNISQHESTADMCANKDVEDICECTDINHKLELTILEDFATKHPYQAKPQVVPVLWTGHQTTSDKNDNGIIDEDEKTGGAATYPFYGQHIIMLHTGAKESTNLTIVDFAQKNWIYMSYIHELCHVFGADDGYCFDDDETQDPPDEDNWCSNEHCVTCHSDTSKHTKNCIMADLKEEEFSLSNANSMLCENCRKDIYNYVYGG